MKRAYQSYFRKTDRRGLLGKWGGNLAQDALLTRLNETRSKIELLVIKRKDRLQWALPGGMVDKGGEALEAATREFKKKRESK